MLLPDPLRLWELTAGELFLLLRAGERARRERQNDAFFGDRLLAFNTAALTLTAVNAPERFPESPEKAFPNRTHDWREAKAEMLRIAEKFSGKAERSAKEGDFTR